jgi:hypothetical protein
MKGLLWLLVPRIAGDDKSPEIMSTLGIMISEENK